MSDPPPDQPETPQKALPPTTPPSSGKGSRGGRGRVHRGHSRGKTRAQAASSALSDRETTNTEDDQAPTDADCHTGSLADDIDDDDNLGLFVAETVPPPGG
jgi:hypothetical protein